MGLSDRKVKQRLVGSAATRNAAWLNDASLPGQRMLAQMGWKEGQSLGTTMAGITQNLTVSLKLDNKGIGAARYEREARAAGKDAWVGGGGDLGSLFDRLNAANSAAASSAPLASSSGSDGVSAGAAEERSGKKRKRSNGSGSSSSRKEGAEETKEQRKERKRTEKEAKKEAKREKKRKRSDHEGHGSNAAAEGAKEDKKKAKRAKREADKAVVATIAANPGLAKDTKALQEIKHDVQAGKPVRLAHRAKFLRAKRMVGNDLASVNEILGIKSVTSSANASGTASPAPVPAGGSGQTTPKTYVGPGGSQLTLMDVDKRLEAEAKEASTSSSSSASTSSSSGSSDGEDDAQAKKGSKDGKRKRESQKKDKKDKSKDKGKDKAKDKDKGKAKASDLVAVDDDDESGAASSLRGHKKTKKDGEKERKSDKGKKEGKAKPSPAATSGGTEAIPAADPVGPEESQVQIGTNAQGLSVHEYLSRRLTLKKAQIARRKKEEGEAVWSRVAAIAA